MAEATLTRTRSVLHRQNLAGGDPYKARWVTFMGGGERPYLKLPVEQWDDLGNPGAITISIWPGDRQDLMEQDDFPE